MEGVVFPLYSISFSLQLPVTVDLEPRIPAEWHIKRDPRVVSIIIIISRRRAPLHMSLFLSLPAEVRARIYDFCFPPACTRVQLIPYRAACPPCRLHLPWSLYLVCKLIHRELLPLSAKLSSLDFLFVIQGAFIASYARPEHLSLRRDDDPDLRHFQKTLRFAEHVRLMGDGRSKKGERSISCASRRLEAGPTCALKVLEVQPIQWPKRVVVKTIMSCLGLLASHPDVADRLEIRLIRDDEGEGPNHDLDAIEDWLSRYQDLRGDQASRRFSLNGKSFDG